MKIQNKSYTSQLLKQSDEISKCVEEATGINKFHWFGKRNRQREYVICRTIYSKMMRDKTCATLTDIACLLDRDHATIIHAVKCTDLWADMKDFYREENYLLARSEMNYKATSEPEAETFVDMIGNKWVKQND